MKNITKWLFLLSMITSPAFAQQKIQVGYTESTKVYIPLLTAIYKEVKLVPEFIILPLERSLKSADNGEIDADIGRTAGTVGAYPNLVETSEFLLESQVFAIVRQDFKENELTLEDLKKYRIGYIHGGKITEKLVKSLNMKAEEAASAASLYRMLINNRFDVALKSNNSVESAGSEFKGKIKILSTPVFKSRAVHIMNKKWADYIPKIDAVVKAMKADGRAAKLLKELNSK